MVSRPSQLLFLCSLTASSFHFFISARDQYQFIKVIMVDKTPLLAADEQAAVADTK
jgi:hypothetical protein